MTLKQQLFVEAYLSNGGNATEAARAAGYKGDDGQLAARGAETVRNRKVQEAIRAVTDAVRSAAIADREERMRCDHCARGVAD